MLDRRRCAFAPGERAVPFYKAGRDRGVRRAAGRQHKAGIALVPGFDLLFCEGADAGHRAVKGIGVGGAESRDAAPGLRKDGGPPAVGVHHAARLGKGAIELQMGGGVGRGAQRAFHHCAVRKAQNHQIGGGEGLIIHP